MLLRKQYPLIHHPCFSNSRQDLWARIHLPVAKRCNVKCIFCDHNSGASCHTPKPGYAAKLLTPDEAISRILREMRENSNLRIVAISGPGEPLFNDETFKILEMIREQNICCKLCLSTNGVLLAEKTGLLERLGVDSISVSVNAVNPSVISKMYEWALIDGNVMKHTEMAKQIISRQLKGIELASRCGITVKVNTVLISGLNTAEIHSLSRHIAQAGASLQNIVPLVPCGISSTLKPPTIEELENARVIGLKHISQFFHCKQCRSDVVGIPGEDQIL